jgi:F420H(2)-dependent quinone reductase
MTIEGDYEPGAWDWVNQQVEAYEASGGREANTLQGTTMPIIVISTRGHRTGKVRKFALMRVEHDGEYALVASKGGMPADPAWVHNLRADPNAVTLQDGPEPFAVTVREVEGEERDQWWERSVAAYPDYAEYQKNTERLIPVFVATPTG